MEVWINNLPACYNGAQVQIIMAQVHKCRRHMSSKVTFKRKILLMIEGADGCVRQVRQQSYESRKVNKSLEKIISAKRALIQRSLGSVDNI